MFRQRYAKPLAILLALALLMAIGFVPTAAQEQVTLGFVYGSFSPQEKWEVYFESFLEEHPEVTINYIPVPLDSWADYTQKIVTLLVGGEQVDVIWNAIDGMPMMVNQGVLRELDSFMDSDPEIQEFIDDTHPKLLEGLRMDGQQYLLPFAWNTPLIYYNKAVFAEAGLPEPSPDWTWSDFLDYAQTLTQDTDGDGNIDVWGYQTDSGMWRLGPWALSNGSFWIDENFTEPWYDRPETIEAVQFVHDLIWEYNVAPSGDFNASEAFVAGTLAMFPGSPANREALRPAGMTPDQYDIINFPTNTGEVSEASIWGTDGYGITQSSQHPELAWEMTKHLVSMEVMSFLLSGEYASASAPARLSLANDPRLAEASPAHYLRFFDALDDGRTVVNWRELGDVHNRYMTLAWANEMTVEEAMANIQSEMKAIIAENS